MDQSSVVRYIRTRSLERVGRGVQLTEQGRILVRHSEIVLAQLEQAEAELAGARTTVAGTIRVAAFQTAALALVPPALSLPAERHPQLRIEVVGLPGRPARRVLTAVRDGAGRHPSIAAVRRALRDAVSS
ncbi:MAG: hypothetical protein ACRC35_03025 [Angustibacter sp.]